MVETAVGLRSFLEITPHPIQEYQLPRIKCAEKLIELHENNKLSISHNEKTHWLRKNGNLNKFLDSHFTQIQKIEILKKIFHGMHTEERSDAIRFLTLLKKKNC